MFTTFWSSVLNFWNPTSYLLIRPEMEWSLRWVFVGFWSALILGIFVLSRIRRFDRVRSLVLPSLFSIPWLVVLYFLRDQQIPFLGSDLLRGLVEIGILAYLYTVLASNRLSVESAKSDPVSQYVAKRKARYTKKA